MEFSCQVTGFIHREHIETLGLLERTEAVLAKSKAPPGEAAWARLAAELGANLANEIGRHFRFEEEQLFPLIAGDRDIAALLAEEHQAILALAERILPRLRSPATGGAWTELRELILELIERQVAHIQKEEMSLLPAIEDALDAERDAELLNRYLAAA